MRRLRLSNLRLRALALLTLGLLAAGCGKPAEVIRPAAPEEKTSEKSSEKQVAAATAGSVTLQIGDEKDLAKLIAAHRGKVVLVDFWATWCGPCVKGFPHTVELFERFQDQGLVVISVSFDNLADEAAVREFLLANSARFENLLSKYDGAGVEAGEAFQVGPLPHLRLYDRSGQVARDWEGKAADLNDEVQRLLRQPAL